MTSMEDKPDIDEGCALKEFTRSRSDKAALEHLLHCADGYNNSSAQAYAAVRYFYGGDHSPNSDSEKATEYATKSMAWLLEHSQAGNLHAQYCLGVLCGEGIATPVDMTESFRLLNLAAEQGHSEAQYWLGVSYAYGREVAKNEEEAARFYRLAAAQGHAGAQSSLARMGIV